ncbi:unnamed protein product, partial [Adineta ricciae]
FASNIQDYVANTVSGVLNPILDDPLQQPIAAGAGSSQNGAPFNFSSATNGPSRQTRPTPNSAAHTTSTAPASEVGNVDDEMEEIHPLLKKISK